MLFYSCYIRLRTNLQQENDLDTLTVQEKVELLKEYGTIGLAIITAILHVGMIISEFKAIRKTMESRGSRIKLLEDEVVKLGHKIDKVESSTKFAHSEMMSTISSQLTTMAHSLERVTELVSNVARRIEGIELERKEEIQKELDTLRNSVTPNPKVRVRRNTKTV